MLRPFVTVWSNGTLGDAGSAPQEETAVAVSETMAPEPVEPSVRADETPFASADAGEVPMRPEAGPATPRQRALRARILGAGLEVFSRFGFRGATIDQIAREAGMTKPNLLYYHRTKKALYKAVLERTLDDWLAPLRALDPQGEPAAEIAAYLGAKLAMSRADPRASRLFAMEVMQGAPLLGDVLRGPLKALVDDKAAVIAGWSEAGRIAKVDPYHLIFMMWAVTQHYADFEVQVRAVLGLPGGHEESHAEGDRDAVHAEALVTIQSVFARGLRPD